MSSSDRAPHNSRKVTHLFVLFDLLRSLFLLKDVNVRREYAPPPKMVMGLKEALKRQGGGADAALASMVKDVERFND